MENSVKSDILKAAMPHLEGRRVCDLVIGISLVACLLDNGNIGVAYVLRNELPPECGAFGFAKDLIGAPAREAAKLFTQGTDNVQRAVGNAVITAAAANVPGICDDSTDEAFGICPLKSDTLGMVGLIKPVAKQLESKVGKLIVFDKGIDDYYGDGRVYPTERESELLPLCSKVIITGSSTINGSIDGLLDMCKCAEKIVIVGSSTPMLAEGWKNTPVTALAGTYWKPECREEIFRAISMGGGISRLKPFSAKKILKLKK
ncbi:MAG: DUF364 domain-containing protein [Bacillota bacterium]|nr:DUF364 domain-containing protein [Bacillota bacterium]